MDWTSPLTNRFLLEAGGNFYREHSNTLDPPGLHPALIRVTEQSTGLGYRAPNFRRTSPRNSVHLMGAASYITGTHALKVGFHHTHGYNIFSNFNPNDLPVAYRFNRGVPNQISQRAFPTSARTDLHHNFGLYAQDKWTVSRLTATAGLRFDYISTGFPEQTVGPGPLTPPRNITFPASSSLNWKDVTPHLGAVYDLFGNGRTALKVSLKKGLEGMSAFTDIATNSNPVNSLITQTTRSWNDANRNFVPDCDLLNRLANGECGALAEQNFGLPVPGAIYDPDLMLGWGKRQYDWEFSTSVQHELLTRTSVNVGYFRRTFGNFRITQNRATPPSAFDFFDITVPVDPRLPGGGGYVLHGVYNLKPEFFGRADDFVTLAKNLGKQVDRWEGVDVTMNMRARAGMLLQGGFSTGHRTTDTCDLLAKNPAPANVRSGMTGLVTPGRITPLEFCHQNSPWLTQVKFLGSYIVPKVDVMISGSLYNTNGPPVLADWVLPNALAAQVLGRPLAGGAANITIPMVSGSAGSEDFPTAAMYGGRINQVDLRFSKRFTFGPTRTTFLLDLYNALNNSSVLGYNPNFAAWQEPTQILQARFAKIGVQLDL